MAPAAKVVSQVVVALNGAPTVAAPMASVVLPVLVSVTVCCAEVAPKVVLANARVSVEAVAELWLPKPVRVTDSVPAAVVMPTMALALPMAVGVKVTL